MIRLLLSLFLTAAAASPAETLSEAVAARRPRLQDPAQILAELTAPALVVVTNQVTSAKPAADVAWEQAAAVAITNLVTTLTGNPTNAVARVGALRPDQMAALVRARIAADPANSDALVQASLELLTYHAVALRRGYTWPLPAHFAKPSITSAVVTSEPIGPAWWEREGLSEPPSIEQILNIMNNQEP